MLTILILGLSVFFQIIAVVLALRLIPITRGWMAWLLIAAALLLIVVRRAIHITAVLAGADAIGPSELLEDAVNLAISALLVAGVWLIRPLFIRMARDEDALRPQMEELQTVMDVAPAVILVAHDPQCRRITGNRAANEVYHVPSGANVSQTPAPGEATAGFRYFRDGRELAPQELPMQVVATSGAAIRDAEIEVLRPDGSQLVIWGNASPLRDPRGKVRGVVAAFLDVTEHRRAEEALRKAHDELEARVTERTSELSQSRQRLATIFRTSPAGIFLMRRVDGQFLEVNDAFGRIIGYSAQDVVGRTSADLDSLISPDEQKRLVGVLQSDGRIENCEVQYRHKSGRNVSVLVNALPLEVDGMACILGAMLDITDRLKANEKLRTSEERNRTIIQTAMDGFWLVDMEGRLLEVNEAYCRMSGYSKLELLAMRIADLEVREKAADVAAHIQKIMAQGEDRFESLHHRKNGSIFDVEVRVQYRPGEGGRIVAFLRDITDRKRAEAALHEANERLELRVAERTAELARSNQDLEQFAYVASHDLQEPLRMITGFVKLLEERYAPQLDETARQYIGFSVEGAARMSNLIHDLLAYSRVTRKGNPLEPVDMNRPLDDALANLRGSIETAGATVTRDELPSVLGDKSQLTQLLQNLVGNALKFRRADRPCQVHVSAKTQEDAWVFSVRDNGIGIAPEQFERIFIIFQRLHTHEEYPGTGIGLAICKKIVEQHGGKIWIESKPGEGSTFCFTLPQGEARTGDSQPQA